MKNNTTLTELYLAREEMKVIYKMITYHKNIKTYNHIGDEGAEKISESLKINTTLTSLYLDGEELIIVIYIK